MHADDEVEGNIYLVKTGNVSRIIYGPSMFDWYPEVTTWDVR